MACFKRRFPAGLSPGRLYFIVPVFLVLTGNRVFYDKLTQVYSWSGQHAGFLVSPGLFHYNLLVLLMVMALSIRLVASLFILVTAAAGYFPDQLGIMIDADMIGTMFETSIAEAADLLSAGFVMHLKKIMMHIRHSMGSLYLRKFTLSVRYLAASPTL